MKLRSDYIEEDKLDLLEDHNSISYRILLLWITFSKHVKSLSYRMNKKLRETLWRKTLRRKVVKAGIEPGLMVSSLLAVGISKKYQQE